MWRVFYSPFLCDLSPLIEALSFTLILIYDSLLKLQILPSYVLYERQYILYIYLSAKRLSQLTQQ